MQLTELIGGTLATAVAVAGFSLYLNAQRRGPMQPYLMFRPFPLLKKKLLAEGDGTEGSFPVYCFTFALHVPNSSLTLDLGVGEHIKLFAPGFTKPRSYSPTALRKGEFDLTVKLRSGGHVSDYLSQLAVGDSALMSGPFPPSPMIRNAGGRVGIICFGVGITEALHVAMAELKSKAPTVRELVLLYANRQWADVLFGHELSALIEQHGERFRLVHLLSREKDPPRLLEEMQGSIRRSRLDASMLEEYFPVDANTELWKFLVVGTKPQKKDVHRMLEELGHGSRAAHSLLQKPAPAPLRALGFWHENANAKL